DRGRGAGQGRDRQRPCRRAFRRGRRCRPVGVQLAPRARDVRDQGGLRRRGRTGPRARALPPVERRRPRRAHRVRARVKHEHHRGVDRGVPRRRQQAPRCERRPGIAGLHLAPDNGAAVASMAGYRIASIGGDGVGPEVVAAGRRVLDAVAARDGFSIEWLEVVAGGAAIDAFGTALRTDDLEAVGACDAVLLGAVGGPRWDDPDAKVRPEQALFALRGGLELFANLRPVATLPALVPSSPVRPEVLEGTDLLIVRELTSGLYFGRPSEQRDTPAGRVGIDTLWYTEAEIRRVVRLAFELARGRRGRLTSVDKANVLATSRLWRTVVDETRAEYAEVE